MAVGLAEDRARTLRLLPCAVSPAWNETGVAKEHEGWPLGTNEPVWVDVVLCPGLRRSGDVGPPARQRRGGRREDRKDREGGHYPPGAVGHARRWPKRRHALHPRRKREAADEGKLREHVRGRVPGRGGEDLGAGAEEDRGSGGGRRGRNGQRDEGGVWPGLRQEVPTISRTADRRRFAVKGGKPVVTFKAFDRDRAPVAETLEKITRF